MKWITILILLGCSNSFAQKKISLKDLGAIDFAKANNELTEIHEKHMYSKFSTQAKKMAEDKLKSQKRQSGAHWKNSFQNTRRENFRGNSSNLR